MVPEKKLILMVLLFLVMAANYTTDFFHFYNSEYLCSIDIPCQNSAKNIQRFLEKKLILLFLLFLVMAAILDFRPDPIL